MACVICAMRADCSCCVKTGQTMGADGNISVQRGIPGRASCTVASAIVSALLQLPVSNAAAADGPAFYGPQASASSSVTTST